MDWKLLEDAVFGVLDRYEKKERTEALRAVCDLLAEKVPYYSWVGFYLVSSDKPRTLVLGPYRGAPTDHNEIPFGRGVCGQVAESETTKIVGDVTQETNYLSCALDVKSEIVVPIFDSAGVFRAQLDIDSHKAHAFTKADQKFLEWVCGLLGSFFKGKK